MPLHEHAEAAPRARPPSDTLPWSLETRCSRPSQPGWRLEADARAAKWSCEGQQPGCSAAGARLLARLADRLPLQLAQALALRGLRGALARLGRPVLFTHTRTLLC